MSKLVGRSSLSELFKLKSQSFDEITADGHNGDIQMLNFMINLEISAVRKQTVLATLISFSADGQRYLAGKCTSTTCREKLRAGTKIDFGSNTWPCRVLMGLLKKL